MSRRPAQKKTFDDCPVEDEIYREEYFIEHGHYPEEAPMSAPRSLREMKEMMSSRVLSTQGGKIPTEEKKAGNRVFAVVILTLFAGAFISPFLAPIWWPLWIVFGTCFGGVFALAIGSIIHQSVSEKKKIRKFNNATDTRIVEAPLIAFRRGMTTEGRDKTIRYDVWFEVGENKPKAQLKIIIPGGGGNDLANHVPEIGTIYKIKVSQSYPNQAVIVYEQ